MKTTKLIYFGKGKKYKEIDRVDLGADYDLEKLFFVVKNDLAILDSFVGDINNKKVKRKYNVDVESRTAHLEASCSDTYLADLQKKTVQSINDKIATKKDLATSVAYPVMDTDDGGVIAKLRQYHTELEAFCKSFIEAVEKTTTLTELCGVVFSFTSTEPHFYLFN